MESLIIPVLATTLAYCAVTIVLTLLVIIRKTKYIVSENGIFVDDLSCATNIPSNTIKSVKLIDQLPKIIVKNSATKLKNIRKGTFMLKLEEGVKEALLLIEDCTKTPVIELVTTSNLIYINLENEEETIALFNEIYKKVKLVPADKLVVYKDKRVQRVWAIIIGILVVTTGLFTFVLYNIVS